MKMSIINITFDEVDLPNFIAILKRALTHHIKPAGWRPSEYAMTKGTANEIFTKIKEQNSIVALDYFEWNLIIGEIARLHQRQDEDHDQISKLLLNLVTAMKDETKNNELIQIMKEQGQITEEMANARRTLDTGEERLWQLQQKIVDITENKPPLKVSIKMKEQIDSPTAYGLLLKGEEYNALDFKDGRVNLICHGTDSGWSLPPNTFQYV